MHHSEHNIRFSLSPHVEKFLSELGIDVYFLTRTHLDQKPIVELGGLALASKDVNNKDVQAIKAQAQKTQEQFKAWLTLWKQGDKDGFKS